MSDSCQSCRAPVVWAVTSLRRHLALDPEPSPKGRVRLTESRVVPGERFATILTRDKLTAARIAGESLFEPHECRGTR